ncbi:DUF2066 domain-containing protein [Thermomonas hydrothermalis]
MQPGLGWLRAALLAAVLGLWLPGVVWAQRVEGDRAVAEGPYQTEVSVRNQTAAERDKAFARALAQVLANLTGDRNVADRDDARRVLAQAEDYVEGYDYRQDEGVGPSGAPSFQTMLVVRFRPADIDDLVDLLGLPRWPQLRPKPVLWLAIDDGRGPRLVGLGQVNAARAILDAAKARGYALGLPQGTAAEQAAVGAIWRGDVAAITALSRRYSPPIQLIGRLRRDSSSWVADWTLVDNGKVLASWQRLDADPRRAMADGAQGAADALFKRYARSNSGATPGAYRLRILGLRSADDYLRLMGYLDDLPGVRRLLPVLAMPDHLELQVELAGGLGTFTRYVDRGTVLAAVPASDDGRAGSPAEFRMRGE